MAAINRFEELCFLANNQRQNIVISSFKYNSDDIINFRYAFAKMSKEIDFNCSDDIARVHFGFVNKAYEFSMPTKMIDNNKFELYVPENYTDELRERNIEICLNASLGKIKGNCDKDRRYWLYYIDVIQDLLFLPSESYKKLIENWMLELANLATPGTHCHEQAEWICECISKGHTHRLPMYSRFHEDFDNNRMDFGVMRMLGLEEFPPEIKF